MASQRLRGLLAAGALIASLSGAVAAVVVPREPAQLRLGERVLVDDGSCPTGQIKEVVGVSNPQAKAGQANTGVIGRLRQCIKR